PHRSCISTRSMTHFSLCLLVDFFTPQIPLTHIDNKNIFHLKTLTAPFLRSVHGAPPPVAYGNWRFLISYRYY
ncbi:TPA: hypothetical protein ACV19X_005235, partial [Escherichia coli]